MHCIARAPLASSILNDSQFIPSVIPCIAAASRIHRAPIADASPGGRAEVEEGFARRWIFQSFLRGYAKYCFIEMIGIYIYLLTKVLLEHLWLYNCVRRSLLLNHFSVFSLFDQIPVAELATEPIVTDNLIFKSLLDQNTLIKKLKFDPRSHKMKF